MQGVFSFDCKNSNGIINRTVYVLLLILIFDFFDIFSYFSLRKFTTGRPLVSFCLTGRAGGGPVQAQEGGSRVFIYVLIWVVFW